MIVNEKKHQALILGKTEHNFCFPVNNSIDIFRMKIDNRFSFDNHEFKFQVSSFKFLLTLCILSQYISSSVSVVPYQLPLFQ